MSDNSSYLLHGEISPFLQKKTRNEKQLEKISEGADNPWDQNKGETSTAYSAFLLYLDLGVNNRSKSKLAKIIYGNEESLSTISTWSTDNDWLNRADGWDRYCAQNRVTNMEEAIQDSEDVMLSYLPKVVLNLAKSAAGEKTLGRAEMRSISDFLDRIGPSKQQRVAPTTINNNLTVNAPALPSQVLDDTGEIEDVKIISDEANKLIPENLQNKRGKHL